MDDSLIPGTMEPLVAEEHDSILEAAEFPLFSGVRHVGGSRESQRRSRQLAGLRWKFRPPSLRLPGYLALLLAIVLHVVGSLVAAILWEVWLRHLGDALCFYRAA